MNFFEYLRAIGVEEPEEYPYFWEYHRLIVCQVQCPECGVLYAMWIGGTTRSSISGETVEFGCGLDTSYWYSFNDEPGEKDRLLIGVET